MNYFEVNEVERMVFQEELRIRYPLTFHVSRYYARALIINANRRLPVITPQRRQLSYPATRKPWNIRHWLSTLEYAKLLARTGDGSEVLLSLTMFARFPRLAGRIARYARAVVYATRQDPPFPAEFGLCRVDKCDSVFFPRSLNEQVGKLVHSLNAATKTGASIADGDSLLEKTESALTETVLRVAERLHRSGARQFITALPNRFVDLIITAAAGRCGILTNEIVHGVNSHSLDHSDNPVPMATDVLYVWTQEYADNIRACEHPERIRVGGYPKFSGEDVSMLRKKYPQAPLVVYFSQPHYDIGPSYSDPVTPELIDQEAGFRQEILRQLKSACEKNGFRLRIRYHSGESSADCNRDEERRWLASIGVEISRHDFEEDLFSCAAAVGVNSSCLYEAWCIGKTVVQIYDVWTGPRFRDLECLSVERIGEVGEWIGRSPSETLRGPLLELDRLLGNKNG